MKTKTLIRERIRNQMVAKQTVIVTMVPEGGTGSGLLPANYISGRDLQSNLCVMAADTLEAKLSEVKKESYRSAGDSSLMEAEMIGQQTVQGGPGEPDSGDEQEEDGEQSKTLDEDG